MATGTIEPGIAAVPLARSGAGTRLLFIDNLRWTMIMLVMATVLGITVTFAASSVVLRRIPLLKRVL